jgi:hypothetical protein
MDPFNTIHSNDGMFDGDFTHYNSVGKQATEIILANLFSLDPNFKILFIPCGHGRNLRHFTKFLDSNQIYASDIDETAIDFMRSNFNVNALISDPQFSRIKDFPKMNIIFVGSLITHLNENDSIKLIKLLSKKLKNSGLMILSSHGDFVCSRLGGEFNYGLDQEAALKLKEDYTKTGYGFAPYFHNPHYGISVISLIWFSKLVQTLYSLRLKNTFSKLWDDHHDIVIFQKNNLVKGLLYRLKYRFKIS